MIQVLNFSEGDSSCNYKTYKFSLDSSNEKLQLFYFIELPSLETKSSTSNDMWAILVDWKCMTFELN